MCNNSEKDCSCNKPWYGKWWIWLIIGIVTIGIIPLIINCIFKISSPFELYVAEWSAGEALTFYGTILGSTATIIAVVVTIIFTNSQNRKSEIFQRNMIVANHKKVYLNEKYQSIFYKLQNIKDVILLNSFENKGFLEMLINKAFMSFPNRLIECYSNIEFIASFTNTNSDIEKEFLQRSLDIIELMKDEYIKLYERIEKAEAEITAFEQQKRSKKYNQKITSEKINKNLYKDILNEKTETEEPISINAICQEFEEILIKHKEKYKSDYVKLYDQYIDYIKQEQLNKIDELYNFDDNLHR